ncbi:unknown [Brachyspira sp. CAG:484]|nr:unknown [Brachyspira sp. CAG:484]
MKKLLISIAVIMFSFGIIAQASDLVIESKTQTFSEEDNKIKFQGDVKVSVDDMKVVGESADINMNEEQKLDTATFYDKPYAYEVKKNKKREVKANILKVSLITKIVRAEGDTQSVVFDGKVPIVVINSDVQEYDTKTGVMTATGAVTIKYKDIESFSNKAIIKTNKNGDLKDLELIGNARVKDKTNESFADKFYYSEATKMLTATGNTTSNATMEDGQKLILKSNVQEYSQDKNTYSASGNVRVWYQDYYAVGPKITVYPDKTTNKPNDIYFTGRSSITQGVRTIYADKIKMMLKPKDFHAEGNTRTVIRNIGSGDSSDGEMTLGL